MKILRLYLKTPPCKGGMEQHIQVLSEYQLAKNHQVKIIFNQGQKVSAHDSKLLKKISLSSLKPQCIGILIFYVLILLKFLKNREYFDVIHIHGDWSSLVFAGFLKRITQSKSLVFSIHDQLQDNIRHNVILPFLISYHNINLVFSTGYQTAHQLRKKVNTGIVFQPSGIDSGFFSVKREKSIRPVFCVITVANLYPKKNLSLVIDIASLLPQIQFKIAGEGPERKKLESQVKQRGINNIKIMGFQTRNSLLGSLSKAQCFLLTSYAEGTPTSALEAMACGLPIIAPKVGGIESIIVNLENGLLTDSYSPQEFADAISRLMTDTVLFSNIEKANRIKAKQFLWETVAQNINEKIEHSIELKKDSVR
jgi:L-malate glycosyltransferase